MENKINKRENKIKPSALSTTQIQRLNLKKIEKLRPSQELYKTKYVIKNIEKEQRSM